jgi:hypothetical protein
MAANSKEAGEFGDRPSDYRSRVNGKMAKPYSSHDFGGDDVGLGEVGAVLE